MSLAVKWRGAIAAASLAAIAAALFWRYVPLPLWKPVFPGLLVALSMLGAAVLVRLARNAPITQPATFDEADLRDFFDALEELNRRLFAIFIQNIVAIIVVLGAIAVVEYPTQVPLRLSKLFSAGSAFAVVWLFYKVVLMAKGDMGFLRLQRRILQNALLRQQKALIEKGAAAPIEFRSPGGYGRAVGE